MSDLKESLWTKIASHFFFILSQHTHPHTHTKDSTFIRVEDFISAGQKKSSDEIKINHEHTRFPFLKIKPDWFGDFFLFIPYNPVLAYN